MSRVGAGRVLVTRDLPDGALDPLRAAVPDLHVSPHDRPLARAELLEQVRGCRAVLTQLVDRVDDELLDAAGPSLELVANYAVGLDNVDVAACTARGVRVSNTPGVLTETTADLAWALWLAVARRVVEADRYVRDGRWTAWSPGLLLGHDVHGKTLGIVGLGRIGQAVARRARGFGVRLLYAGPRDKPEAAALGAERVPLERLLAESDAVSLHCPLSAATRHLIDGPALARMRPDSILINTGRGPLVDEAALVEALRAGRPGGAGLDVFEDEPRVPEALRALPNVALLPHVGSATREARLGMARLAAGNVLDLVQGRPLRTCVNPEAAARRSR